MSSRTTFTTIRTEGALLPPDILTRIAAACRDLGGLTEATYHLSGEKFGEATNRAWNRLQSAWVGFQSARQSLPTGDAGTTVTRERWLLPLFQLLDFGRLQIAKSQEIGGKTYTISHGWQHVPIHFVGFRVDLDTRANKTSSPHSLLQEFLNRSEGHLWGIVSNGLRLRLLRDNVSLTRQAYVEFDLEAMMSGEAYSDFVLLWLLLHQSRFEGERPELDWIEKWSQAARTEGVRVLDGLSDGVQQAIEALGQGALSHPANTVLLEALKSGVLAKQDYYRELLRLVYRLLFLFVAEDRELLLDPNAAPEARERYRRHYATTRIRSLAVQRVGSRHDDLYRVVKLVMNKLAGDGCPELALPALGSFLFSSRSTPHLDACEIPNRELLKAFRSLAVTQTKQGRRTVDYKNLGAEELGSVYESLLELHPVVDTTAASFELKVAAGSERKKTGSYYTPSSLISVLLDSAVDPVLAEASRQPDPERAILNLKVLDPACGSGHFLIAAAHRIAKSLASVRSGDEEPAPEAVRHALRDVIGHSIYGVDLNPMAVELCKVSLWMEALEPGKPLSFLEHRIQVGNSLLGTTPRLMSGGIPDEAFQPLEGDTKEACTKWRKVNKSERKAAELKAAKFAFEDYPFIKLGNLAQSLMALDNLGDDTIAGIRAKSEIYEQLVGSGSFLDAKVLADAWCAAFVWRKDSLYDYPITEEVFRRVENNPQTIAPAMRNEIEHLAREYHFFHWHLAFPDVFHVPPPDQEPESKESGWSGGFDVVLGNPPWERVKLQEKEWFAERSPEIANVPNAAARRRLIEALKADDPALSKQFLDDLRKAEGESHFISNSGRYPLCGRGDINTYAIFAEGMRSLLSPVGRFGCVLPSGIATDDTTKFFFQDVVEKKSLVSLFDFENKGIFPGVHNSYKFCLFTSGAGLRRTAEAAEFVFFAHAVDDLRDPERRFILSSEEITLLNPNTHTCPVFRSRRDANLCLFVHRRHDVILREEGTIPASHKMRVTRMFDMNKQRDLFKTGDELTAAGMTFANGYFRGPGPRYLRLLEGKTFTSFDHRLAVPGIRSEGGMRTGTATELTEEQHNNPGFLVQTTLYIDEQILDRWAQGRLTRRYSLGFMDVTSATNHRTAVCAILPDAATDYSVRLVMPAIYDPYHVACLAGLFNSFVFDYLVRQKLQGLHLSDYITYQLAVPTKDALLDLSGFVLPRVLELTYTAWDLEAFAMECGWSCPPFRWDEERRFLLRCELDAAFFHLYFGSEAEWCRQPEDLTKAFLTPRHAVSYIMETFPIVKRREEQRFRGDFRTKRVILEIYDTIAACGTVAEYRTRLDPPPADPRVAHQSRATGTAEENL
jgi:hypothetical protein